MGDKGIVKLLFLYLYTMSQWSIKTNQTEEGTAKTTQQLDFYGDRQPHLAALSTVARHVVQQAASPRESTDRDRYDLRFASEAVI